MPNTQIHTLEDLYSWLYTYTYYEQLCMDYYKKHKMLIPDFIRDEQIKNHTPNILDTMRPIRESSKTNTADVIIYHEKSAFNEKNFINDEDAFTVLKHPRYHNGTIHSHDFFEFAFIFSGQCKNSFFSEDNQEIILKTNDAIMITPHTYHKIIVNDESIVIYILIRFSWMATHVIPNLPQNHPVTMQLSKMIIDKSSDTSIIFHLPNLSLIRNALCDLILEYCSKTACKNEIVNLSFCKFLLLLMIYGETESIQPGYHSKLSQLVPSIITYINQNYASITCGEIADHFHFTLSHLNKTFRKVMNTSLNQYLIGVKMDKACELLSTTRMPINEIALLIGYADSPCFNRAFRQIKQISPNQYRKEKSVQY